MNKCNHTQYNKVAIKGNQLYVTILQFRFKSYSFKTKAVIKVVIAVKTEE